MTRDDAAQNVAARANGRCGRRSSLEARGYYARYDETSRQRAVRDERAARARRALRALQPRRRYACAGRSAASSWCRAASSGRATTTAGTTAFATIAATPPTRRSSGFRIRSASKNRVTVTGGLRYDHHSIFGDAWSPKLGVNVRATDESAPARARTAAASARPISVSSTTASSIRPTSIRCVGNPSLQPERSGSVQVGGDYSWRRRARVGVNLFHNDVDDMIESVNLGFIASAGAAAGDHGGRRHRPVVQAAAPAAALPLQEPDRRAHRRASRSTVTWRSPAGFSVSGAYTYLQAEDRDTRSGADRPPSASGFGAPGLGNAGLWRLARQPARRVLQRLDRSRAGGRRRSRRRALRALGSLRREADRARLRVLRRGRQLHQQPGPEHRRASAPAARPPRSIGPRSGARFASACAGGSVDDGLRLAPHHHLGRFTKGSLHASCSTDCRAGRGYRALAPRWRSRRRRHRPASCCWRTAARQPGTDASRRSPRKSTRPRPSKSPSAWPRAPNIQAAIDASPRAA